MTTTPGQRRILLALLHRPARAALIAAHEYLRAAVVSRILDDMAARGYVRTVGPGWWALTAKGLSALYPAGGVGAARGEGSE